MFVSKFVSETSSFKMGYERNISCTYRMLLPGMLEQSICSAKTSITILACDWRFFDMLCFCMSSSIAFSELPGEGCLAEKTC
jgi:hypothetical protein